MSPTAPDEPPPDDPDEPDPDEPTSADDGRTGEAETNSEDRPPAPDWLLDNIAELSRNARSLYLIYLGFLAYCAITIVGTTDRQILLDESVRLPLVGVDVSFTGFFVIAPLVAIGSFVYLQLYLQRLKRMKEKLRAEYQPTETGRLYPWMLNVVDDPNPGLVGTLQRAAVTLVLWWMLPVVLFLFAFWYLKAQDPVGGWIIVVAMPPIGVASVLYFWWRYEVDERSGRSAERVSWSRWTLGVGGILLQVSILVLFVQTTIYGKIPSSRYEKLNLDWAPDFTRSLVTVDASYQSLITEQKYGRYWVDLSGKRLHGANLRSTTLINADLRNVHLEGAHLRRAKLDSAYLRGAHLQGATLVHADFRNANLMSIHLSGAHLRGARLQNANFMMAHLDDARLENAYLNKANLVSAHLEDANLLKAQLEEADLRDARLDSADLSGANLKGAIFANSKTIFAGGKSNVVHLQRAELARSTLDSLRCLAGTEIHCSQEPKMASVVVDALCESRTLEGAILDPPIREGVEEQCPAILKGRSP